MWHIFCNFSYHQFSFPFFFFEYFFSLCVFNVFSPLALLPFKGRVGFGNTWLQRHGQSHRKVSWCVEVVVELRFVLEKKNEAVVKLTAVMSLSLHHAQAQDLYEEREVARVLQRRRKTRVKRARVRGRLARRRPLWLRWQVIPAQLPCLLILSLNVIKTYSRVRT